EAGSRTTEAGARRPGRAHPGRRIARRRHALRHRFAEAAAEPPPRTFPGRGTAQWRPTCGCKAFRNDLQWLEEHRVRPDPGPARLPRRGEDALSARLVDRKGRASGERTARKVPARGSVRRPARDLQGWYDHRRYD